MLLKAYLVGSMIAIVLSFVIGCFVNRSGGLGHTVRLGILNSLLLGAVWPLTAIVFLSALVHDGFVFWKRL